MANFMKPLIGITPHYDFVNKQFILNDNYALAVERAGGVPVVLPFFKNASSYLDLIDGLLVSGGGVGHVTGEMKKKNVFPSLKEQNLSRYKFESFLIRKSYEKNIPILGICRGFQMIIEVLGGTVDSGIKSDINHSQKEPGSIPTHKIKLLGKSVFSSFISEQFIMVNSFHRQGVSSVPDCLRVTALAPDGVVEAVEGIDIPIFAFQFHPERLSGFNFVFENFIKQAKNYRKNKKSE